jgi:uncharacterized membrane protein (DUF485 family)
MYDLTLHIHSVFRYLVLAGMLITIIQAFRGLKSESVNVGKIRKITLGFVHLQFITGLILYFVSPLLTDFFSNFSEMVKVKEVRFFAMEHSLMMIISTVLVTIGNAKAKGAIDKAKESKITLIWFTIALIIIFIMIPWNFIGSTPSR